jgi:hypothetical protein
MIDAIRSQQAHNQAAAINQLKSNIPLATYQGRDSKSGDRILTTADGGQINATYLGTNKPSTTYSVSPSAIGTPGYLLSK